MRSAVTIALVVGLAGCSAAGLFGGGDAQRSGSAAGAAGRGAEVIDAQGLAVYLELMRRLVEGDAVTQADAFADAADAFELVPTTTNRLKYALALAMPGHAGSDPGAAERRLSGLLADNTLLPEERVLAEIHLASVSERLLLDASAEQLRQDLAQARAERDADSAAELQAVLEENRRLQENLEEAAAKLDAITSIEQSIRDRENEPELP